MEYMEDHLTDWLGEELAGYGDEDYLVLDCPGARRRTALAPPDCAARRAGRTPPSPPPPTRPAPPWIHSCRPATPSTPTPYPTPAPPPGQIELYSHVSAFRSLVDFLKADGWAVCAVYCLDCHFITEAPKYIAGAMQVGGAG
jgi:hypothetical protein